jgi:carboxylate-amine ligase
MRSVLNPEPALSIGIEEEYLLIDPRTRDLVVDPPRSLWQACEERLTGRVTPEFMRSQIEVGTPICKSVREARRELANLRRCVGEVAADHGVGFIAASTHPFATWRPQKTTDRQRYSQLAQDIGTPVLRLLTCAMHVHVGIDDPNTRIDLMNQARYFLPHLLALTTSSPFWQGQMSSLKSYRLAVFAELPRTGVPDSFQSYGEYEKHLDALVGTGVIEDGTKIWWDIRPSAKFPTLEMRVCDICTRLEDAVSVTALYVCILRMLWRLKRTNITWRSYKTMLINENRWRAMRYGVDEGLIDFGRGEMVPYADLLEELIELVAEDAARIGCVDEVLHAREILARGTSAHRQLAVHEAALADGATPQEALNAVVDWLVEETAKDVDRYAAELDGPPVAPDPMRAVGRAR